MENIDLGMTRDQYMEMCEALGNSPVEEEIPVEFEDLPLLAQTAVTIYETLTDQWEYVGGNYTGKNLQNLFQVFELYEVEKEEQLFVYKILCVLDNLKSAIIQRKKKN